MVDVKEEVERLESLRGDIKAWQDAANWLGDFVDHARPSEAVEQEALAAVARYDWQVAGGQRLLHELVADLRQTAPEVIEAWVSIHQSGCQRIVAQGQGEGIDPEPGLFVATEMLAEREKARQGEAHYACVNDTLLRV